MLVSRGRHVVVLNSTKISPTKNVIYFQYIQKNHVKTRQNLISGHTDWHVGTRSLINKRNKLKYVLGDSPFLNYDFHNLFILKQAIK
jgi:hypothetical protein